MGAELSPGGPQPDVLNYAWRDYGNRVGAWRILEAFRSQDWPLAILLNSALCESAPQLVRFPGGHVFKPHWHESNERIIVIEGRLAIGQADQQVQVDAGGYAFLPAREIQYLTCTSKTRCTLYLGWDGKFASHNPPVAK